MRKTFLLSLPLFLFAAAAKAQYWQQQVNYAIDVSLDDTAHSLRGFEKIDYVNNSPDTLRFIWFHIWPNAYKSDRTAFSDQLLENGSVEFYFSDKEQKGYINRLDFKVNGVTAETRDHPQHIDIIRVMLPAPLAPGQTAIITTPFHVKLPFNFSRGGHEGQSYQLTQWYPKPAVYDRNGWHPMPYLDQGEFYSDFGDFDVRITLPANYAVAATGELQDAAERNWLIHERGPAAWGRQYQRDHPMKKYDTISRYLMSPAGPGRTSKTIRRAKDSISNVVPVSSGEIKTLRYRARNVHDFAWFADKRFVVEYDSMQLPSGKTIDVFSFYTPRQGPLWKKSIAHIKAALRHYSAEIGDYPYPAATAVQGPESFGGGMEYPMITVISPVESEKSLDNTIAHEVGHNWFYGILATNEREHPWLDEGLNSFYDDKYHEARYGKKTTEQQVLFTKAAIEKTDQPIATSSEAFTERNYGLVAYYQTSEWLRYLESVIGKEKFQNAMREYYRRWQFRHPGPDDFRKVFSDVAGPGADTLFSYLDRKGILPVQRLEGTRVVTFLQPKKLWDAWLDRRDSIKNIITVGPAIGVNKYDKLMIGAVATNYNMIPTRLRFFLAPMYATGSKGFTGIGHLNYSVYREGLVSKFTVGLTGSTFSADQFTDDEGTTTSLRFSKIVPAVRVTFKEHGARSTLRKFVQFKTYFIGEEGLRFFNDTTITGTDTSVALAYRKTKERRTLNQLMFVVENDRVLYPYRGELKIEQGRDFLRAAFTGNYYFNYAREGGARVRFFAGKFFCTSARTFTKQFETDRYHLNMTGANGYEDYSYSEYFAGRNEFEGLASQQIMVRDGAFKVRTDLLADKVGRTDDWLMAVNLSTTIPSAINPLSLLPFDIPLKLFVDIGTYAEPWKKGATGDRFLFDAGIQVSLLKELINVYFPLLYSKVYKDYFVSTLPKKNRFFKIMSFSIDISNFNLKKFNRNLDFK